MNELVCGVPLARPLPEGVMVVDAVVVLKVIDQYGNARAIARATGHLPAFEALGMVEMAKQELVKGLGGTDG